MASLESTAYARQWNDQLTAELNGHREKLGNLETYEEDAKSSRLNLLVRWKTALGICEGDCRARVVLFLEEHAG